MFRKSNCRGIDGINLISNPFFLQPTKFWGAATALYLFLTPQLVIGHTEDFLKDIWSLENIISREWGRNGKDNYYVLSTSLARHYTH